MTPDLSDQQLLDQFHRQIRLADSRPILVHLGLRAVAATTPYSLDAREVAV